MQINMFIACISIIIYSIGTIQAQTIQDIGKVVLGVKVLSSASSETQNHKDFVCNKIRQIVTQAGYSSYGDNTFIISPNVIINDVSIAEGGMRNIYIISGELTLSIQDQDNGTVFTTTSLPFKGSAIKKDVAIKNAISNIDFHTAADFFEIGKTKILSYYEDQENLIFARADSYVMNKEYDEAITCLMTIPEELYDLHKKALIRANEIYELRDEEFRRQEEEDIHEENENILNRARSFLAMYNPTDALKTLWNYKIGDENQDQSYYSMISQAEKLITETEKRAIEKEKQEYIDQKERLERQLVIQEKEIALEKQQIEYEHTESIQELQLERQRIEAIKAVAFEYLKSHNYSSNIN